ncbi:mother cell sporulation ATPase [Candidatus Hydrogenisulfobacillus filiaventi]|uniref:Mother cell sporulation ATPase n=1 Tax=Candidatus Hydrogenisulfobacillus filiaventi TaxID=2707344 RepID=A0A6F8ZGH8_9FIRM|nr:AAA family ATPase [Bacillota bacterium]CAB1128858.1 mother cell sporulation ATPase [Candidatus Hydrogenisulfobacillus filiaventi]
MAERYPPMAPGREEAGGPGSPEEVFRWLEAGRLPASAAVRRLRDLDPRTAPRRALEGTEDSVEAVLAELDRLVGLDEVKRLARELTAFVEVQRVRSARGLAAQPQVLHMIFRGAPGTGKTTVARLFGRLFQALGVLPRGHLVEVERADLVGEYIGHTAQKTREMVKRALGGVLFVDEAYSLARGGEKDFGREATDVLVKAMEDHRGEFLVILAGYSAEMEYFLGTNPGLRSRFAIHLTFPEYSARELVAIAARMVGERQYRLTPEAEERLLARLEGARGGLHPYAGNARLIRNWVEAAIRRQAVRLAGSGHLDTLSREALMTLTWADFEGSL